MSLGIVGRTIQRRYLGKVLQGILYPDAPAHVHYGVSYCPPYLDPYSAELVAVLAMSTVPYMALYL